MTVEELEAKATERRNVLVGIRIDSHSRELLSWAIAKVAEPGDCVVAVHVCGSSGHALRDKLLLDSYLEVGLSGQIAKGISVRRTLVREARNYAAVAVIVGISSQAALRVWASTAKYCAKRLRPTTDIMAIHNGKFVFRRCNNNQLPGLGGDPKPSFNINENLSFREIQSEFGDSEAYTEISSFELLSRDEIGEIKDEVCSIANVREKRSNSLFSGDILDQRPGWPSSKSKFSHSTELAFQETVCSTVGNDLTGSLLSTRSSRFNSRRKRDKHVQQGSERRKLRIFHTENLIGKGGCSRVYKGILPDGKPVAVKVQKKSQKAMKDFALEVEIISSLNHKHITPLVDVCIEDDDLIYVYDFLSKGSLEENLHEALNYLHSECSRPVIHRDVKSSNILLSDGFEPKLSDFGLAIWGPATTSFVTRGDVVGTFGYIAPEYFMYGKVSDKIDVYAIGVVLLELLSGRKPISSGNTKSQESLVLWAKPIIESGNAIGLVDPNLNGNFDEVQMQRMILKLLRGDKEPEKWGEPSK
ncbi:receptor-like protein kinase [Populus alba x Populus x berolinensis]|nr:receptor-like protein kinase [Populus alba x Populus x berolinensis]